MVRAGSVPERCFRWLGRSLACGILVPLVVPPAVVATAFLGMAAAETPRAELGKRLRRFELAWQDADAARRAAAVAPMKEAVESFFTLRLATAAARLDDAWLTVRDDGPADPAERRDIATAVTVAPLLADTSCDAVLVSFEPLYEVAGADEVDARLRLTIEDHVGTALVSREGPWGEATESLAWTTGALPAGDHRLVVERLTDDKSLVVARIGLSRAERLDGRLARIRAVLAASPAGDCPSGRATVAALADLLGRLAASHGEETDYPAARLLGFAEALLCAEAATGPVISAEARRADCWLTLSDGRGAVPVRLRAPPEAAGPLPVLFLFHGAGGSENMFFETYGAGRAVALGIERGWLVVAPRQPLFGLPLGIGAMLDVLDEAFEIDRSRIFAVGHSMGAMQTAKQATLHPRLITAAAAIGGGGTVRAGEEAGVIPWFVAAGAADFGGPAASSLASRLRAAGNPVEERLIADVEHMVVVQAALDELFAFLDAAAVDARPGELVPPPRR